MPSRCHVDPQKLENTVEKSVGRLKCGLVGGRRAESRLESPFPIVLLPATSDGRGGHSPLVKISVPGARELLLLG